MQVRRRPTRWKARERVPGRCLVLHRLECEAALVWGHRTAALAWTHRNERLKYASVHLFVRIRANRPQAKGCHRRRFPRGCAFQQFLRALVSSWTERYLSNNFSSTWQTTFLPTARRINCSRSSRSVRNGVCPSVCISELLNSSTLSRQFSLVNGTKRSVNGHIA